MDALFANSEEAYPEESWLVFSTDSYSINNIQGSHEN